MTEPLPISVVIPAHNDEAYIEQAIASLRDGTRRPAEILVVDDGSRDTTAARAEAAGARVISLAHAGVCTARNTGVEAAKNPWIAFLDSDDVAHPDRLDRQWNAHLARPTATVIVGDAALVRSDASGFGETAVASSLANDRRYRAIERTTVAPGVVALERASLIANLARWNSFRPSTVLVVRELALAQPFDASLPVGPDMYVGEDWEWFLRLALHADFLVCEGVLTDYRLRAGSASSDRCRMTRGDLALGALVMSQPEIYTPEMTTAFARWRDAHYRAAARACAHAGKPERARLLLREALHERRNLFTLGLIAAVAASDSRSGRAFAAAAKTAWNRRPRIRRRLPEA